MKKRTFEAEKKNVLFSLFFLTKNREILEFLKISILSLGYPGFQKRKRFFFFCSKLILQARVKEYVQPLSPPTRFLVTTTFRGNRLLMHVLKSCDKAI